MLDHARKEIRPTSALQRQFIKHNSTSYVRNFNLTLNWVNFIKWLERIALTRDFTSNKVKAANVLVDLC